MCAAAIVSSDLNPRLDNLTISAWSCSLCPKCVLPLSLHCLTPAPFTATSWAQPKQSWRWTGPGGFRGEPAAGSPPPARGPPPSARLRPSPRPSLPPAGGTACGSWAGGTGSRRRSPPRGPRAGATKAAPRRSSRPSPGEEEKRKHKKEKVNTHTQQDQPPFSITATMTSRSRTWKSGNAAST